MIGWGDKLKICKIKSKSINQAVASTALSGSGLAAALVGNEKKETSTFVEISN